MGYVNVNLLHIQNSLTVLILFGDSLYCVQLLVSERLSCPVILGTYFPNRYVEPIWCTHVRVQFSPGELPIFVKETMETPWSEEPYLGARQECLTDTKSDRAEAGDESATLI